MTESNVLAKEWLEHLKVSTMADARGDTRRAAKWALKRIAELEDEKKKLAEATIQDALLLLIADASLDSYALSDEQHKDLNEIVARIKAPAEAERDRLREALEKIINAVSKYGRPGNLCAGIAKAALRGEGE